MGLLASVIHHHEEWIIVRQTCEDLSHSLFPRRPLSTGTAAETCRLEGKGAAWKAIYIDILYNTAAMLQYQINHSFIHPCPPASRDFPFVCVSTNLL